MGRRPVKGDLGSIARVGVESHALGTMGDELMPPDDIAERGRTDLYYLCTEILDPKRKDGFNEELHREYCTFASFATNPAKKKLGLLPREHLKTTMGTVGLAIQEILIDPNVTILIANAVWEKAREMLDEIEAHFEHNEKLIEIYGEYKGAQWNKDSIKVSKRTYPNKTPTIETAGLDKSLTSAHYKRIILDDLVVRANVKTMAQVELVIKFYKDCLDLLDKKEGKMIIHGTRWGFWELYAWILKHHKKDFAVYLRRAVEDGKIIFPERFTNETLKELRRQKGDTEFVAQYFNHVRDVKNALVKPADIRHYTQEDLNEYLSKYPGFVSMVVDGAVESREDACETAITVVMTTIWDEWILLDVRSGHWEPGEAVEEMAAAIDQWRPSVFGMQKTTFEKVYKVLLERTLRDRNIYEPEYKMLSKNPHITKHQQIMSLRPRIERKQLFWKADQYRFEVPARQYPRTVAKDVLDSLSRHTEDGMSEVPYYVGKDRTGRRFVSLTVDKERLPWKL